MAVQAEQKILAQGREGRYLCNVAFFFKRVARQLNDLQPVQQWPGHVLQLISSSHKHYLHQNTTQVASVLTLF